MTLTVNITVVAKEGEGWGVNLDPTLKLYELLGK